MKFTSGIVLSALTIAASSPTIVAAPFPGGNNNNANDAPNTPLLKSPDPSGADGALSPRARGIERFGGSVGPSGQQQRRSSGMAGAGSSREKRDTHERERRQLPSLAGLGLPTSALNGLGLPLGALGGETGSAANNPLSSLSGLGLGSLGGLGLDPSTLAALEGQATAPLSGLGLGGLTGTASGLVGQAGNLAGTVSGAASGATGLLNGLPVAGPILGQVEGAAGLQGLLGGQQQGGQGGAQGGSGGLASTIPIGSLQQALLAQAVQIQQLEKLVQSSLPLNLPNLPDASNLVNTATSTVQNPSLSNVANAANGAVNSVNSAAASAVSQVGSAASSATAGLPVPPLPSSAPSVTSAFMGANQAANPAFAQGGGALDTASAALNGVGIQAPVLPGAPAALAGLTGQLGGLAGQASQLPVVGGVASQLPGVGGVASQVQGALGSAQGQLGSLAGSVQGQVAGLSGTAGGLQNSANNLNAGTQNWLPPAAQGALDPANALAAQYQAALAQLQQQQQNPLAFVPNTGKVLAAVPGTDPDQRITPAGAARTALDNNPAADSVPDTDNTPVPVPAVPATPQQAQEGENAASSDAYSVQTDASTVQSQLAPTTGAQMSASSAGAVPSTTGNPMTYLAPPLTADPTQDNGPTDIAFYTSAVPTTSAASAPAAPSTNTDAAAASTSVSSDPAAAPSAAPSATPVPSAPAKKVRRQVDPAQPQAPTLPSDDSSTDAVTDQSNSSLQPLAPQVAPYLQQYVNGYQAPQSPADSFVSAWSVPMPSSAMENLPTPSATMPSPTSTVAAFLANQQEVKAVAQKASPSPYGGWSQDTDYSNDTSGQGSAKAASSSTPSATRMKIHDPAFQALNTPPPIPAKSRLRFARREAVPAGPPSNWSQDTNYTGIHGETKAPLKGTGKKTAKVATPQKAPVKAGELLSRRQDMPDSPAAVDPSTDAVTHHKSNSTKPSGTPQSGTGGRPAMTRQKAYDGKNPDHKHKSTKPKHTSPSSSAAAPAPTDDAAPASPAPADADPAPAPAGGDDAAPERRRMVRFARSKRDSGLGDLHQPPAGEHGEPPAAPMPAPTEMPSSDPPAYSSADDASPSTTSKSKSGKKKSNSASATGVKKGAKETKGPKKTKSAEPAAATSSSAAPDGESDADAAAPAKMRKRWMAKLSMKKWL